MNIASLDIGTNTALLLIANISNNEINCNNNYSSKTLINPIIDELRMPRLGKGLRPGGIMSEDSVCRLMEYLKEYSKIIREYDCSTVLSAGTNAFRIASNSSDVIKAVKKDFNIDIEVITGEKEARLTFIGSRSSASSPFVILIDIGGGSTEITLGKNDNILFSRSFQAGAVTLSEKYIKGKIPTTKEIFSIISELGRVFSPIDEIFYNDLELQKAARAAEAVAVAGTPVSIASIKLGLRDYNKEFLEGYGLDINDIRIISGILRLSEADNIVRKYGNVLKGRGDIIVAGSLILEHILEIFQKNSVTVSTRGLRYGIILDHIASGNYNKK